METKKVLNISDETMSHLLTLCDYVITNKKDSNWKNVEETLKIIINNNNADFGNTTFNEVVNGLYTYITEKDINECYDDIIFCFNFIKNTIEDKNVSKQDGKYIVVAHCECGCVQIGHYYEDINDAINVKNSHLKKNADIVNDIDVCQVQVEMNEYGQHQIEYLKVA